MKDLWGFKNAKDLEKSTADMPNVILREQIGLLGDKTGFVLYGKVKNIRVDSDQIDYKLATIFDVMVPELDDYRKTLFILYSNPEKEYPVAITVGSSYEDDCEAFEPFCICENKATFDEKAKELFSSPQIMDIIHMLYAKAVNLSV